MNKSTIRLVILTLVCLSIGQSNVAAQTQIMPYPNIAKCKLETLRNIDLSLNRKTAEALSNFANDVTKVQAAQTFNQLGFNQKQQVPDLTATIRNTETTIFDELKNTNIEDFDIVRALRIENEILPIARECALAAGAQNNVFSEARMEIDNKVSSNISRLGPRLEAITSLKFDLKTLQEARTLIDAITNNPHALEQLRKTNMSSIFSTATAHVKLANQQSSGEYALQRLENNIDAPFECIVKDRTVAVIRQNANIYAAMPPRAIEQELDGKVVLQLKLSSIGEVTDANFIEVSDPVFRSERILQAAKRATYWPKIHNCQTSSDEVTMPLIFAMN